MPAYKDAATNKWYTSFYYTNWKGRRLKKKKMGFKRKQDALDWEREFLQKSAGSPEMSFGSLVEIYMGDMNSRLREHTMINKKYVIDSKVLPFFETLPIADITAAHIRKWQNGLIDQHYAPTYLKSINNQLSAIFNYAVRFYNLSSNPCHRAGSMGKKDAEEMHFWTLEEYNKVIKVTTRIREKVAFELMFWSGIRVGELLALTLDDFNFETLYLNITESYQRLKGRDVITDTKTLKSNRTISIPNFVCDNVKDYIGRLYGLENHDRIFETTKDTFSTAIKLSAKKAKVKQIRVHDLRHSHAALCVEMGMNILAVSERLGHENIETTLGTYGHLYPNKQDEIRLQMENLNESTI